MKSRIYEFAIQPVFLVGIILLAIGSITEMLVDFTFAGIIGMVMVVLPIAGLMQIYMAARAEEHGSGEATRVLSGITLCRTVAIIQSVLFGILLVLMVVITFITTIAVAGYSTNMAFSILGIGAVVCVALAAYLFFYCIAQLNIYKGLREGIHTDHVAPLRGVMPLTVMAILSAIADIVLVLVPINENAIADAAVRFFYAIGLNGYGMDEVRSAMEIDFAGFMADYTNTALLRVITYIGMALLLVSLNRFNNSLKEGAQCNGSSSE
jgi:hypothetical protein